MVEHQDEDILLGLMVLEELKIQEVQVVEMVDIKTYTKLEQLHKHQEEPLLQLMITTGTKSVEMILEKT